MRYTQKIFISIILLINIAVCYADDKPKVMPWNQGLSWHIGADVVSSYLLRGWNYGGLAVEPHGSITYAGATVAAWANIGAHDWAYQQFSPQLNITLSYQLAGFSVGVTHLHYFNSKYFDFSGKTYEQYINNTGNFNQTELFAVYNGPEKFPVRLSWYTYVGGNDKFPDYSSPIIENADTIGYEMKRTFSTYIELAYTFNLPAGFILTPAIGVSPWKGYYTRNTTDFTIKNIEIRVARPFALGQLATANVWAVAMLDCHRITAKNFITTIDDTWSKQRFNVAAGISFNLHSK